MDTDSLSDVETIIDRLVKGIDRISDKEDDVTDYHVVERVSPKCKVTWNQYDPYNKYCFTSEGYRAVAGCVAIAGAQALTVLQPKLPIITSWEEIIKESPTTAATDEIAKLVKYIGDKVHMKYGVSASSARTSDLVSLFKSYGITDYDAGRSIDVLKTKHGVIVISGRTSDGSVGHAFLADGYIKYSNMSDPYYLHINYGYRNTGSKNLYVLTSKKNGMKVVLIVSA